MSLFDVSAATVQSLDLPDAANPPEMSVEVVLAGQPVNLALAQYDVRSPAFQLIENGLGGPRLLPTPACVTYRGAILGDLGSSVAATYTGGSITAYLRTGTGELWVVQPVNEVQPTAGPGLHIVFRGMDSVQLPVRCGVNTPSLPAPTVPGLDVLYEAEIAIEADYPFFQLNGSSTTNTTNDVTGIVNAMNIIYERDVDIRLTVSQLIVNTSADPYSTNIAGTLLTQFRNNWNATHGSVARDFAHLFTGRNIGAASGGTIGVAYVGVVCNLGSAYGISQNRFTSNYGRRVAVTAHEIGHNFGAGHCDSASPCYIMCSGLGGCNNNVSLFSPSAQNQIIGFRQTLACLTTITSPPTISSLSPTSVNTANPVPVVITGSGFVGATRVNIGSTWLAVGGFQVLSDTQLRFTPPQGLALGFHLVNVVNSAGTSNSVSLSFTAADPAELVVPSVVLGGTTATWTMGGWNGDLGYLVISLVGTSSPWLTFNLLDNPTVLWQGLLDARGMATYSFPVPAGVFNGLRVYTQLIDIRISPLGVRSLSPIKSTLIFL
ncbi:MAG: IPT/TIG domain-containing protein [Planctomycetes bacterium]|nr:IPT/TIG domain-containing protein [Planctomycetota bacterium]